MKLARRVVVPKAVAFGCLVLLGACSPSSEGGPASGGTRGGSGGSVGSGGAGSGGTIAGSGGNVAQTGGAPGTGGSASSGGAPATGGARASGGAGSPAASGGQGGAAGRGTGGAGATGQAGAGGGAAPTGSGGQGGGNTGAGGTLVSSCKGAAWPTSDPTSMGPYAIVADKGVGPLAGAVPDPVYMDERQHFNVYRPKTLGEGGRCHPILVWNNGYKDNPEPKGPCVSANYCGSYKMLVEQMASHGFVVIASLSTISATADPMQGNRLPGIVGLDWLLEQAEDPASPYYHHLDTAHIGAFGHSMGGAATCAMASDPRFSAIATVSGTRANPNFREPALLICGGKDGTTCQSAMQVQDTITTQPAIVLNNIASDHGGWLYQNGAKGPTIFGMTAWFRYYLMGDTAQGKYFFGANCTFCSDSRVTITRNNLAMMQ